MKILILGSSGQIGKYLYSHLISDYEVLEFDIERDLTEDLRLPNNRKLSLLISECDFVFFLAFDVGGSRYLAHYEHQIEFILNNMKIMTNVFELISLQKRKFIFASSQMSNMTHSPYGILKLIGENATRILGGRVVKFWNVYGYEAREDKFHVISDFIFKAKNFGKIDLLTDGEETRDFLYAKDCVEALEIVMNNYDDFSQNDSVDITSFQRVKIIDIANMIAEIFNVPVNPGIKIDSVQRGISNEPSSDILKFWHPRTDLMTGIKEVINSHGIAK
jgi:nucleoside-diphosphate-sugar epimerase